SAGTRNQKTAQQAAGKWQAELVEGRYQKPSRMTWEAFRDHYAANAMTALADSSATTYDATLNVFERLCNPQKLSDVTTAKITGFATELRAQGLREATVARHLRAMKVVTRWAHGQGLLAAVPKFAMPKRAKGAKVMRGRPITLEEFERMLAVVAAVVENAAAESWKFYLRGLWASGLRLSESLTLRWDDAPGAIVVDFTGRRPMLRIPCEAQKGNRDTLLPITPEFATLLEGVPERERRGRVFKLLGTDGTLLRGDRWAVGKLVSAIGEKAGVVVDERQKSKGGKLPPTEETVRKFASAHDLRRAFGQRWAAKVMPTVLRELMRHESIETTMKYYVGQNAEATADALWATTGSNRSSADTSGEQGNTLGNTSMRMENSDNAQHAKHSAK
ncbi:MAG TPA: site-specific integrase, partial [Lacipirellulaceae bacterium]